MEEPQFHNRGAIVRIRIRNFMTYDDTELRPGPNLNMILGPNGTGKSAVVCCIIVGLAGEVNLTGRGGSAADFVKKNTDQGSTEIELYNRRGGNYIIQRIITITDRSQFKVEHKSEWKINGKVCRKAEVQKLTQELNIKVDNLCQFLPQDSVTQFVKMNTFELLHNTLKAAGDNQLVEDHQKLVEFTRDITDKKEALDNLKVAFKENEVNKRRLEAEVTQLRDREEYVKQKKICAQKIFHIAYLEEKAEYDRLSNEITDMEDQLRATESNSEPYRQAVEEKKADVNKFKDCIQRSDQEVNSINAFIQKTLDEADNRKQDFQREFCKFKCKEDEEKERSNMISFKKQELENLENKLLESREVDCSRQLQRIEADLNTKKEDRFVCQRERRDLENTIRNRHSELDILKRDMDQIRSIKNKKLALLRAKVPDAFRVHEWLAKNRDKFQSEIYSPIMCEINVKDPRYNRVIEHAIPRNDLCSFVCLSEQDLKTFTRLVRDELKIRFNVILAPEKTVQEFESEYQRRDLSRLGAKAYLKDLIDAPEPIMRFLYGSHNFHMIPVAESTTEAQLQKLLATCPKFYNDSNFYSASRSRYDGEKVNVVDLIRDAQYLQFSLDTERLAECQARLVALENVIETETKKRDDLIKKDDVLKNEWQTLVEKHSELKRKHEEKRRLEGLILRTKEAITRFMSEKVDIEVERKKLEQSIDKISRSIISITTKVLENLKIYVKCKELQSINLLLAKVVDRNYQLAQKMYSDAQKDTTRLTEAIRLKKRALGPKKNSIEATLREAEEKIPNYHNGQLDKATKRKFDSIPENSREALDAKMATLTIRIQKIFQDPTNTIMDEFNRQMEDLRDKQSRISELEGEVMSIGASLNDIKNDWLAKLNEVISIIDTNYREFMQKLSYDGQVKLDYDLEKPDNFAAYGIMILVKYRDSEKLIPLSSTRQSGGERSVATMIYMLALQTKTTAPFRCVDEINQGMDKENERKVFELLVKTADSSSSQYFLVSPKLLSNLPYSPKMSIHVVFNGKKLALGWNQ